MFIIGSFFVANKLIVIDVPVFVASEIRLATGAILLFLVSIFYTGASFKIDTGDLKIIVLQVFFGVFLFSIFSLNGIKSTSAINSGIIMGMTPVAMMLLAIFAKKEKVGGTAIVAGLIAFAGAVSLNLANATNNSGSSLRGDGLVFLAMLGEAVFITAGKFTRNQINPLIMSALMAGIGALMFLPLALISAHNLNWSEISMTSWVLMLYSGIGISALGVLLMNYGSRKLPISTAASLTALMPASTCILAVAFLDEKFKSAHILGLGLIFASALLSGLGAKKNAQNI